MSEGPKKISAFKAFLENYGGAIARSSTLDKLINKVSTETPSAPAPPQRTLTRKNIFSSTVENIVP